MSVSRMVLSFAVSTMVLGGAGCQAAHGGKGESAEARQTASKGVADSADETKVPKPAEPEKGGNQQAGPKSAHKAAALGEFANRKKTWCDERPVEVQEDTYPDGKKRYRYEVVMDEKGEFVRHGKTMDWWDTGQQRLELHYVCGVKHGPKQAWWKDGAKWSVGAFFEGRDHGTWKVWDNAGTKIKQYHLDKGVWNGMYIAWHTNGKKKFEVEFVDGLQQGLMTFWDDQGNMLKQIEYLDGKEQAMPGA